MHSEVKNYKTFKENYSSNLGDCNDRSLCYRLSKIMLPCKKIEAGVVDGYKKIETGVTDGYTKIEDKFVDAF